MDRCFMLQGSSGSLRLLTQKLHDPVIILRHMGEDTVHAALDTLSVLFDHSVIPGAIRVI